MLALAYIACVGVVIRAHDFVLFKIVVAVIHKASFAASVPKA